MHERTLTAQIAMLACAATMLLGSTGCVEVGIPADGNKTHGTFWPLFGMHDDPAFEDQQAQDSLPESHPEGMRYPAPKTVSREHRATAASADAERAETLHNPVPINEQTLRFGKIKYEKTCAVCHGKSGEGDGPVARQIPTVRDISSATARAQDFSDGRIYRIISHGINTMWSYKSQLKPMERWAVVNYVRALQRAHKPEPWDYEE